MRGDHWAPRWESRFEVWCCLLVRVSSLVCDLRPGRSDENLDPRAMVGRIELYVFGLVAQFCLLYTSDAADE